MRPDDGDNAYVWDMLKYARRVVILSQRTNYDAYCRDWTTQMAMERAMEVIGEAANRISLGFQSANPEIPWPLIVGQRNILAHEYGEVRNERIWEAATIHVPALIESLELLAPQDAREDAEER